MANSQYAAAAVAAAGTRAFVATTSFGEGRLNTIQLSTCEAKA